MRRVLFITGKNQYGVVDEFLTGMQADLAQLGFEFDELNLADQTAAQAAAEQLPDINEYTFIVSFNGVGNDIKLKGGSFAQYMQHKPIFLFMVDHPIRLIDRFIGTAKHLQLHILCVAKEHVEFCQMCGVKAHYFPHAYAKTKLEENAMLTLSDKSDEVLYPVSYLDLAKQQQILQPVWHEISAIVNASENITQFMQALGIIPNGRQPASRQLNNNLLRVCLAVDLYLRAKDRLDTLTRCAEAGVKLTVIGNGVKQYQTQVDFHDYQDAISVDKLLQKIKQAKAVLHNSPGFIQGLHERIIFALANGTAVTHCKRMPFVTSELAETSSLVPISQINSLDALSYQNAQQLGFSFINQQHTWLVRWENLLTQLKLI